LLDPPRMKTLDRNALSFVTGGYDFARTANAAATTGQQWSTNGAAAGGLVAGLPGAVAGGFGGAVGGALYGAGRDAYQQLGGQ